MNSLIRTSVLAAVLLLNHVDVAICKSALIVVDVQDCFLPGGSLYVNHGEKVIPVINKIRDSNKFDLVVFTLDWHPPGHVSFASAHLKNSFERVTLKYLENGILCLGDTVASNRFPNAVNCGSRTTKTVEQRLWPDHCIENVTSGPTSSKLAASLTTREGDVFVKKGTHKQIDSYSAFFDNGHFLSTPLNNTLRVNQITQVFLAGFAIDICVYYSSLDAKKLGYETFTIVDASLAVNPEHIPKAEKSLAEAGIHLIKSTDIPALLNGSEKPLVACLALVLVMLFVTRTLVFV